MSPNLARSLLLLNSSFHSRSNLVGKKPKWKKSNLSYLWCSLPRMYVINKEVCLRTVCQQDEYRKGQKTPATLFEPTNVTETSFAHYSRAMPRIVWVAQACWEIFDEEWLSQSPWQRQSLGKHGLTRPPASTETKSNSCHHKKTDHNTINPPSGGPSRTHTQVYTLISTFMS